MELPEENKRNISEHFLGKGFWGCNSNDSEQKAKDWQIDFHHTQKK